MSHQIPCLLRAWGGVAQYNWPSWHKPSGWLRHFLLHVFKLIKSYVQSSWTLDSRAVLAGPWVRSHSYCMRLGACQHPPCLESRVMHSGIIFRSLGVGCHPHQLAVPVSVHVYSEPSSQVLFSSTLRSPERTDLREFRRGASLAAALATLQILALFIPLRNMN